MRDLTPLEARIVGVLVEKQATVPDTYPLSLNALVAGCSQKTAREPVMNVSEPEALAALQTLRELHLVNEVSGSRVTRYEHNLGRVLGVPSQSVAILATLMLRGPQTPAELRANCERLHRFADVSSVEAFFDELAAKVPPRVVKLARAPGSREARWAHTLCGAPALPAPMSATHEAFAAPGRDDGELQALRAEVASLRALVHRLARELGVEPNDETPTPET